MFDFIITGYRWIFLQMASVLGPGWSIVALSFICSALMTPLMKAVAGIVKRESDYQSVINPQLEAIKAKYSSDMEQHLHIQRLYSRYSYSPLSAVKKVMPLFVQIPFLLLTYYMLKDTAELNGVSFLFLKDLGQADALAAGINILPLVMTGVNLLTVVATPGFTSKDQTQAVGIALLFLVLLYTAPSALLLYWALNNTITMFRTLLSKKGEGAKLLWCRFVSLKHLPSTIWAMLTPDRLNAISLVFFFASIYMWLMVKMEVWFFNCFISKILMVPTLFLAVFVACVATWKQNGRLSICGKVILFSSILASAAITIISGLMIVAPRITAILNQYVDFNKAFFAILIVWLFVCLVKTFGKVSLRESFIAVRSEAHWLLIPIILGLHYSFSSDMVKLPVDSVMGLILELIAPCFGIILIALVLFGNTINRSKLVRVAIAFCFAAYLVPMISLEAGKLLGYESNLVVRLAFIAIICLAILRFNNRKSVLVMLGLLVAMTLTNAAYQRFSVDSKNAERAECSGSAAEMAFKTATHIRHNNIYLLVYDSYTPDEILADLGIKSRIRDILLSRGFTRYDAYSVGSDTVVSMGNSFSIGGVTQGSVRSMMAGNNPFCDFLKRGGYRTNYLLCAYDMPGRGEKMPGDFYFPEAQKVTRLENVLYKCILSGYLSQSANTFNSYTQEEWVAQKRRIIDESSNSNIFVYAHSALPGHATANEAYRSSMENEIAAYADRLSRADEEMETDIEKIIANDKDAVVIVASDHGSCLLLCDRGDYGRNELLDRCGIQLFVRWPEDYQPTLKINCFTDIFLETMIYLTGDASLARYQTEGVSLPVQAPLKAPAGAIKNGIIQSGRDKGKSLFR